MTTTRKDHRAGYRYILVNILTMLPFIPLFVIAWRRGSSGIWDHWTWTCIVLFVLGAIFGLWYQRRRETRFRCPECRTLIVGPIDGLRIGHPIIFYCDKCDIRWETGSTFTSSE